MCECHQEMECCSGISTLQTEKQSTENSAPLAEAESVETDRSPLATEMVLFSGFATAILAVSRVEVDNLPKLLSRLEQRHLQRGEQLDAGLVGKLQRYLRMQQNIYSLATELLESSRRVEALAGMLKQAGSPCQCEMYKGKSLG